MSEKDEKPEGMEDERKFEECEDPELEDLLQSTLEDFASKPVGGGAGDAGASAGEGEDSAEWDEEKFINEAKNQFEMSMRALLSATAGGTAEEDMSKVFDDIFKNLPTAPPAPGSSSSTSAPGATVDPMEDVLQMMARMQNMGVPPLSPGGDEDSPGGAASLMPIMSGLLKQVLSKDVLYPAMKSMLDRFPAYMEENRGSLKQEDVKRYDEQQRLMKQVCEEFDAPGGGNFDRIFGLMQEMQNLGHPPKEVIDGAENPVDLSALGLDSAGQSDCSIC